MNDFIGKLNRVPLREVWPHEAHDFTRWFEENYEVLNEEIGLDLVDVTREQSVGDFSVDLYAVDENGDSVVIENQLEKSDHNHLGKLITYLSAMDAKTAIWIVAEPRAEHIAASNWLNETNLASFYLVQVEAVRIGESPPAPLLTKIVAPSEEIRRIGQKKEDDVERYRLRRKFWDLLLERAQKRTSLHSNISPSRSTSIKASAGNPGLSYYYSINMHDSRVGLKIDRGQGSKEENLEILNQLKEHQNEIENRFGDSLEWEMMEGSRTCRIKKDLETNGYRDPEEGWSNTQDEMIDAMIRLEEAFRPYIRELNI
jgi:hypothetical protein